MGHNPSEEELIKMIMDVDSTGDGAISKNQIIRLKWFFKDYSLSKIFSRVIWWWYL